MSGMLEAMRVWIATGLVLALSACGLQADLQASGGTVTLTPSPAPATTGKTVAGSTFNLAAEKGHPVVVDFFGSWCGPCRAEQPDLNSVAKSYQSKGVYFIGIAMRDDPVAVAGFEQTFSVPYTALLDDDGSLAAGYDISSPPTIVVIDKHGDAVAKYLATVSGLSTELNSLLKT
jgi:thiol-disulfide isomerase/thioredoxin